MAAKHSNAGSAITGVFTVAAVLAVVYVVARLVMPRAAQAATAPGGVYSNGGANPYGYPQQGGGNGILSKLGQLLGLSGRGSPGGSARPSAGAGGASGAPKSAAAQYPTSNVWSNFYNAVQDSFSHDFFASNPVLGGDTLVGYEPDYAVESGLSSYQIPEPGYSPQLFDVNQSAQVYTGNWMQQDYADSGAGGFADTTSYYGDFSIDG
jgi:hypothetical protein